MSYFPLSSDPMHIDPIIAVLVGAFCLCIVSIACWHIVAILALIKCKLFQSVLSWSSLSLVLFFTAGPLPAGRAVAVLLASQNAAAIWWLTTRPASVQKRNEKHGDE